MVYRKAIILVLIVFAVSVFAEESIDDDDDDMESEVNATLTAEEIAKIIQEAKDRLKVNAKAKPKETTFEKKPANKKSPFCKQGDFYCGRHLHAMGYTNTAPNVLYECGLENEAVFYTDCSLLGCEGDPGTAYCPCIPGVEYCGWELRTLNLMVGKDNNHVIYKCKSAYSVKKVENCTFTCQSDGDREASCAYALPSWCKTRKRYCGLELVAAHGFNRIWGPQLLYECVDEGDGTPRVKYVTWCKSGCISDENDAYCDTGRMGSPPNRLLKDEL